MGLYGAVRVCAGIPNALSLWQNPAIMTSIKLSQLTRRDRHRDKLCYLVMYLIDQLEVLMCNGLSNYTHFFFGLWKTCRKTFLLWQTRRSRLEGGMLVGLALP